MAGGCRQNSTFPCYSRGRGRKYPPDIYICHGEHQKTDISRKDKEMEKTEIIDGIEFKESNGVFWYPLTAGSYEKGQALKANILPWSPKGEPITAFFPHLMEAAFMANVEAAKAKSGAKKSPVSLLLVRLNGVMLTRLPRREPDNIITVFKPSTYVAKENAVPPDAFTVLDYVRIEGLNL